MMTEREKASLGLPYLPADEELSRQRLRASELCYDYNHLRPSQTVERAQVLAQLLGCVDASATIVPPFHCDYGYNVELGANFYANTGCVMLDCAPIRIGNNVLLAPNVGLYTALHPLDAETRNTGLEYAAPITIGDNVWLCAGVQILPGVTIGRNTVVGAGSVVHKDLPEGVLAIGNPCRVVRPIETSDRS